MKNSVEFYRKVFIKKKTKSVRKWTFFKNKNKNKEYGISKGSFYKQDSPLLFSSKSYTDYINRYQYLLLQI